MLNWMKEIVTDCFLSNELDGDDFHLGFDVGLPVELRDLIPGKKVIQSATEPSIDADQSEFNLDEHELAMG